MKITRNIGMLLLALWLVLTGLIPLLNLSFSGLGTVMAVLAVAAGILIVVGRRLGLPTTTQRRSNEDSDIRSYSPRARA